MGLPQPSNPPTPNESVSGVLVSVTSQLEEIEKRLNGFRDRLQSRANQAMPAVAQVEPPAGLVGHAMQIRNTGARLMTLTDEIAGLL